jgi:hypothetical protein
VHLLVGKLLEKRPETYWRATQNPAGELVCSLLVNWSETSWKPPASVWNSAWRTAGNPLENCFCLKPCLEPSWKPAGSCQETVGTPLLFGNLLDNPLKPCYCLETAEQPVENLPENLLVKWFSNWFNNWFNNWLEDWLANGLENEM